MLDTQHHYGQSRISRFIDEIEETIIAIILALMVTITFINVVLRYGFNSGLIWGLEMVTFLFAWLVLLGISYAVKKKLHLGVDALVNICSAPSKRVLALTASILCILYACYYLRVLGIIGQILQTYRRLLDGGFQQDLKR